jgi:hypothetical protein
MKPAPRRFHPTGMRRNHEHGLSVSPKSRSLMILAAFSLGMLITFAGTLIYSTSQQGWASVRAEIDTRSMNHHLDHTGPVQSSIEEPARTDEQQQTSATPTDAPDPSVDPIRSAPEQPGKETLPVESRSIRPGSQIVLEPLQKSVANTVASAPKNSAISPAPTSVLPQTAGPAKPLPERPQVSEQAQAGPLPESGDHSAASAPASQLPTPVASVDVLRSGSSVVTVERGTSVDVRLAETLSSDHNRSGDTFRAVLERPLIVDNVIVAGVNSTVLGRIADIRKASLLGGRADLTLTLTEITTQGGRVVKIDTTNIQRLGSRNGLLTRTKLASGAAVGAVKGAVNGAAEGAGLLAAPGNENASSAFPHSRTAVVLPAGTQVSFNLTSPFTVPNK